MKRSLLLIGVLTLAGTQARSAEFAGQAAMLTTLAESKKGFLGLAAGFGRRRDDGSLAHLSMGLKCALEKYESRPAETIGHMEPLPGQTGAAAWRWVPARGAEYAWRVTMTQVLTGTKVWSKDGLPTEYQGNIMALECYDMTADLFELKKYQWSQARPHPVFSCLETGKDKAVLIDQAPGGNVIVWETSGLYERTSKEECSYRMEVIEALGIK